MEFCYFCTHKLKRMFFIVESGATKTAWRAVSDDGTVRSALTSGLSPTCLDLEQISDIVREAVPVLNPYGRHVSRIYFYGAGLVSDESSASVRSVLDSWCPFAEIEFHSDILGAARALFGDGSGVVAIMGTGSNSCLYENGKIVKNIRPGGYVLGDEGSGVALGRAFLADFVKGMLPSGVESAFVAESGLDYPAVVRKVYKESAASAFMASLAPFILSHASDPYVRSMVEECLDSFIRRTLARYGEWAADSSTVTKVGVVGSFGCACEDYMRELGKNYGLEFIKFIKSPVDELVRYHGI